MFTEKELLQYYENNKNAKKYKNGSILQSNNYGNFKVIGRKNKHRMIIQFIDTGNIIECGNNLKYGEIMDKMKPSVCDIGFIGIGEYSQKNNFEIYQLWRNIIHRCYNIQKQENQPTYIGCTISKEWCNFQNFCKDIKQLMMDKGIENLKGYHVDKDIKFKGNKIYSKETVSIVTVKENISESTKRNKDKIISSSLTKLTYKAIHTDGRIELFENQSMFAKKYNLNQGNLNNHIKGKSKSICGWKIEQIPELE